MSDPTAAGSPLDQVIADYLQAAEAGRVPSRQALLDAHPEYADDLRAFFADYDRLDNRADALKLAAHRPPAERPKVRYFGDYELLEEIAEGGMGLVYKARQETLGRIVALKLVRAGRLATPIDIARFRIEAEAAAALDHPNIVPLYEVGDQDGQHYLAMKFIDGPSLAKLPRGDIRAEVAMMETVARAVHHAHQQGIIHRDVKPSNILTDSAGTPYVTDFGLAKRIDAELSLTESGQMLGTAGYVAPEQALGKKGLTVTADVFSLGAVLFERLTGTPAFPGGTILERLRSLHESITPRPTLLMPTLPRDLETVVLKCLEREPTKRYATAGALADDLARWLRGEPIVARRVTQVERFWLWCRRNPAVAGLTGATAAALIVGTGVSSYFAVEAKHEASVAVRARDDAVIAQNRAERSQMGSFLRPLGYNWQQIDQAERGVFFELAELAEDRLRLLFLEVALADPDTAFRLARRSDRVVQTVVGASGHRRQAVLSLAAERQRAASADPRIRLAACWIALELGSTDLPAAQESCLWAAAHSTSGYDLVPFVAVENMSDEQVRLLHPISLAALSTYPEGPVVAWTAALAMRLDRSAAIRFSDTLVGVMTKTKDQTTLRSAFEGIATVADQLDGAVAARASEGMIRILGNLTGPDDWQLPGGHFAVVLSRLDAPATVRVWNQLVDLLGKTTDYQASRVAREGLAALTARLDGPAVIRASDDLVDAVGKTADVPTMRSAAALWTILAPRLDAPAAGRAWDGLVCVLGKSRDDLAMFDARNGLRAVAPKLDGPTAIRAADRLIGVLGSTTNVETLQTTGWMLAGLADRLDAPAASRAWEGLVGILGQTTNGAVLNAVGEGLAALGARLDRARAIRASDNLMTALPKWDGAFELQPAAQALEALAPQLDEPAAIRAWDGLLSAMGKTTNDSPLRAAANALLAVAKRLGGPATERVSDDLIAILNKTPNSLALRPLASGLAAVAPRLHGPAVIRACDGLVDVLAKTTDLDTLQSAVRALATISGRLDGPAAVRAWDGLVGVLANPNHGTGFWSAGDGLAVVGGRLDGPAASRAWTSLVELMGKTTKPMALQTAMRGFAALATRLDGPAAIRAFDQVLPLIEREGDLYTADAICEAALMVTQKMDAGEAQACRSRLAMVSITRLKRVRDRDRLQDAWDKFCFVIDEFEPAIDRSIAAGKLPWPAIANPGAATYDPGYRVGATITISTADLPAVADCLRHPACVGETRQLVLHRLEELAFPPADAAKQQALAESVVTGMTQPLAGCILAAGRQAKWERERKFRTTWDAVEWLNKNHPEIDLDKPYKPRK